MLTIICTYRGYLMVFHSLSKTLLVLKEANLYQRSFYRDSESYVAESELLY